MQSLVSNAGAEVFSPDRIIEVCGRKKTHFDNFSYDGQLVSYLEKLIIDDAQMCWSKTHNTLQRGHGGESSTFALLRVLGVQRIREQIWEQGPNELAHYPDQYTYGNVWVAHELSVPCMKRFEIARGGEGILHKLVTVGFWTCRIPSVWGWVRTTFIIGGGAMEAYAAHLVRPVL